MEASKMLAAHAMEVGPSFDARLDFITARLIGRPLRDDERKVVKTSYDRLFANYSSKPDEAKQLLNVGSNAAPAQLDVPELACLDRRFQPAHRISTKPSPDESDRNLQQRAYPPPVFPPLRHRAWRGALWPP
ncbi:MAG: hypothetical protein QM755_19185 [Luteolibacter sp.]